MENSVSNEKISSTQEEMKELRERLNRNKQTLQNSTKKSDSTEFLSLIVKSTVTFEKV
ncbi:hypothetical protein ACU5DF_12910 [Aliivibrio wodanis]|uniref:hypothetical protein n=1 Tax=Aliivibrio wodanis TaxID=80852 RepID=UPI00406C4288